CFTRGELRREKTRSSQPLTDASAWATSSSERTLVNGNPPSWRNCRLRKLTCARNGPRRYDRSAQSPARGAARFALRVEHGDKLCQCPRGWGRKVGRRTVAGVATVDSDLTT